MSKLSRKRQPQPLLKLDDDEDDDFITPSRNLYQEKKNTDISPGESDLKLIRDANIILLDDINPSVKNHYKYGDESDAAKVQPKSKAKGTNSNDKIKYEKPQSQCKSEPISVEVEETVEKQGITTATDQEDAESNAQPKDKVVCPFCWKKLNDKLTGMTHVKTCGKDLPTERIFEALQLHEKQVREWEYLGIAYPGFQQPNKNAVGKPAANPRAAAGAAPKPNRRKKKDPELDLAIALSVSLHEEIEDRKRKEKEYLVEIGLEKEVEFLEEKPPKSDNGCDRKAIDEAKSNFRIRFGKETKVKLPKFLPLSNNNAAKPRGRGGRAKPKITETALYKMTDVEREDVVNRRVVEILEKSESENRALKNNYPLMKTTIPEGMNERLEACTNVNSSLWNLASTEDPCKESFYTPALIESKNKVVIAVPQPNSSPIQISQKSEAKNIATLSTSIPTPTTMGEKKKISEKLNRQEFPSRPMSTGGTRLSETFSLNDGIGNTFENAEMPQVVQDLLKLFVGKVGTDLTLYGLEEKPIRAHKLIIMARCPKLLEEIVVEQSSNGKAREVIPLTCFTHAAVKSFVWLIYSGSFLPPANVPSSSVSTSNNKKVEDELAQLCQMFNMSPPPAGACLTKPNRQSELIKKQLTNVTFNCKYVEKSVQTDAPVEPHTTCVKCGGDDDRQDEIDLSDKSEVQVFNDSGDIFLEGYGDADLDLVELDRKNVSDDGSCDLFGEYFLEEEAVKENDISIMLKKRSRSLSPSKIDQNSSSIQATKKYKLNLEIESRKSEEHNQLKEQPSLVILDESDDEEKNNMNIEEDISNSSTIVNNTFKDSKSAIEKSPNESFRSKEHETNCPNFYHNSPSPVFPLDDNLSPLTSRNSFSYRHTVRSKSQRLSMIRESDSSSDKLQTSSDYVPRAIPFSPIKSFDSPNNFHYPSASAPLIQNTTNFPWDNDDSVLSKIPDDLLVDVPIHSRPTSTFTPSHSRSPSPAPATTKTKGKSGKEKLPRSQSAKNLGKNKTKSKISSSQGVSSAHKKTGDTPVTPTAFTSSSQPCRTPLLNYSTIDTPILKAELKKFGLKPLPRSKAKVLLRHIYEETHK